MSIHKYVVATLDVYDAALRVSVYIDDVLDDTVDMGFRDWTDNWKNFDDLIRIHFNQSNYNWEVEILSNDIENYELGDIISWMYDTTVNYTFEESAPVPPTPTGGFDIHLMNNTEELNKISKSPTLVRTLHGVLKDETDIVNPEILIEFDGTLTDCNYMHIPTLSRYYFITKITSVRNKLWRVSAHCDVLKTYSEGILGTRAVVSRNEKKYNLFLNDSMYKVTSNPRIQIANFPNKFEGQSYVLVMNGANYSTPT